MTENKDKVSIWQAAMDSFEYLGEKLSPKEKEKAFKGNIVVD